ncbi:hypothetical protein DL96DRAFT_1620284 [Flagelloscypha sp. PMI_526]|nr:hypothetical protein DL96DRAFT_1620284 [Flagelloscypha sp. PMI_526]
MSAERKPLSFSLSNLAFVVPFVCLCIVSGHMTVPLNQIWRITWVMFLRMLILALSSM